MEEKHSEREHPSPSYFLASWFFLRILAAIYFTAFISLAIQIQGLVGSNGILPARNFLQAIQRQVGVERYWLLPTLCWFNAGDLFLQFLCYGGAFLSFLIFFDIAPAFLLGGVWIFYLSLLNVCQDFLSFQWDILLLEAGFLAIFLAPLHIIPKYPLGRRGPPPKMVLWLFRWLLFRLMFSSGVVKLSSGDPTWRNLTALNYHYETQPLPTWMGWYVYQLPAWFQKASGIGMFVIELVVPFLIFAPRRLRLLGGILLVSFQILIMATGNYCFFNLLTMAFCLLLLDDAVWPRNFRKWSVSSQEIVGERVQSKQWPKWVLIPLTVVILLISAVPMTKIFRTRIPLPFPVLALYGLLQPLNIVNGYGLFAVMTTSRPEIIMEGSEDGVTWFAYEFKWKPGDLSRKPAFVEPHQPRLDWQMWFAALGSYRHHPWFMNFMVRLLEGSPEVTGLLAKNPFPDHPPTHLRAVVYDYHFTDLKTLRTKRLWWRRTRKGLYCPILSRKGNQIFAGLQENS